MIRSPSATRLSRFRQAALQANKPGAAVAQGAPGQWVAGVAPPSLAPPLIVTNKEKFRASALRQALAQAKGRLRRSPPALLPADMEVGERKADHISERFVRGIQDRHHADYIRKMMRLRAASDASKALYMEAFNAECAGKLTIEEAALERLCKLHAYMRFPKTQTFTLNITRSLVAAQQVTDIVYAREYYICDTLVDRAEHLKAQLLLPVEAVGVENAQAIPFRAIILFEGTCLRGRQDLIAKMANVPSGMRANLDARGIGRRAFARNKERIMAWVDVVEQQGRAITLTGHSLGGALAARTLAALPLISQAQHRLVTFDAPGIDRPTALKIAPNPRHTLIRTQGDIVPFFGERHPDATVITLPSLGRSMAAHQLNHVYSQLSDALLHGLFLPILHQVDGPSRCSATLEWARKGIGSLTEAWQQLAGALRAPSY